jgi:hypothetical protein
MFKPDYIIIIANSNFSPLLYGTFTAEPLTPVTDLPQSCDGEIARFSR